MQRLGGRGLLATAAALALAALVSGAAAASNGKGKGDDRLQRIDHIVVIYEENHSFDNLYGGWEGVNGRLHADPAPHDPGRPVRRIRIRACSRTTRTSTSPPLSTVCSGVHAAPASPFTSHFRNAPFTIDDYIKPDFIDLSADDERVRVPERRINPATGQPVPGAGRAAALATSCTSSTRRSTSSTAAPRTGTRPAATRSGLTMGYYDTRQLPIYRYLHGGGHRTTRSPTTSSRPRSAGRSSTISG